MSLYPLGLGSSSKSELILLNEIRELLRADYFKGDTRFIKYLQGTQTIILDKDVTFDPDTGYTITEHQ